MARKRRGSARLGKISVLRLLHLLPGVGVALIGDGTLGGAVPVFQSTPGSAANPAAGFGAAAQEFTNDLAITYFGYKPSDGSTWYARGYPFRTYAAHFAIELTRYLVKRFVKRKFNFGPFTFP